MCHRKPQITKKGSVKELDLLDCFNDQSEWVHSGEGQEDCVDGDDAGQPVTGFRGRLFSSVLHLSQNLLTGHAVRSARAQSTDKCTWSDKVVMPELLGTRTHPGTISNMTITTLYSESACESPIARQEGSDVRLRRSMPTSVRVTVWSRGQWKSALDRGTILTSSEGKDILI